MPRVHSPRPTHFSTSRQAAAAAETRRAMAETDGLLVDDSGAKATMETPAAVEIDPMTGDSSVEEREETVFDLLRRFGEGVFLADAAGPQPPPPFAHRMRFAFAENVPRVQQACRNSGRRVLLWTRRGSPLRALLVISVSRNTLKVRNLRC